MRFTIRDVLWLTLVVGLIGGWWVDRGRLWEWNQKLESAIPVEKMMELNGERGMGSWP